MGEKICQRTALGAGKNCSIKDFALTRKIQDGQTCYGLHNKVSVPKQITFGKW
jgi:hypothetical protein